MEGLILFIFLIVVLLVILLIVYLEKRKKATQTLLIEKPVKEKTIAWKTSQEYALVGFLVSSLNQFQKIQNQIQYCQNLIKWYNNRKEALKFLRKNEEISKEAGEIEQIYREIVKLNKDKNAIIAEFVNLNPIGKDKSIASLNDFNYFKTTSDDALSELLQNLNSCRLDNGIKIFFCANFYLMSKNYGVKICPYFDLGVTETTELQATGYSVKPAIDDEIVGLKYLHERKRGGPDKRYTYNPATYIVRRGIVVLTFRGDGEATIKFSNTTKSHFYASKFLYLVRFAGFPREKEMYAKMISMNKVYSATDIFKMMDEDEYTKREEQKKLQVEGTIRQQKVSQEKPEEQHGFKAEEEKRLEEERRNLIFAKEIKTMKTQPVWNQYEAALLLKGYLEISKGADKQKTIERLSKMLRRMAVHSGIIIDEIYRNINGITLQMDRMRMAMTGQIDESRKPAKVFLDVVSLYKSDKEGFDKILLEAKEKCGEGIKQDEDLVVKVELPPLTDVIDKGVKRKPQKDYQQKEDNIKVYDFQQNTFLGFTKPLLVMYFGEINSKVQSWSDVYCSVLLSLWQDYPSIIKGLAEDPEFTTISYDKQSLRHAMEITSSLFAEGNRSATDLGQAIRQLLDICNVDYENVVIRYVLVDQNKTVNDANENFQSNDEQGETISDLDNDLLIEGVSDLDNEIYDVIKTKYLNGFLIGAINFKKIRRYYEEIYAKQLTIENNAIEKSLRKTCIFLDGKYYAIDALMQDELKNKVAEYIQNCINSNGYVYYKMIMDNFGYELTEHIPDSELLKKYLSKVFRQYVYFEEYMARSRDVKIDVNKEVEQVLLDSVYPISFEKICALLPHLTEDAIRKTIIFDDKIIVTNNNDRFHIDSMGLTDDDVNAIKKIIDTVLQEHNCMFGNELLNGIKSKLPNLYESIKDFGDRGIRGAVAYKLKGIFKFNSNIICNIGVDIDNAEVFRSFAKTERYFSLAALIALKDQIGIGNIYFDNVNEVASRINANDFVPNEALVFNVNTIDELLEQIITGNMASIKEASNFAVYPSTCYPWTEYLLESYVAKYSKKFKLLHVCYAESKCSGAIVKRSSQIDSMDAVIIEYLILHEEIQSGNDALSGLVEDGYIARKRYKNIEDLLIVAKAKRRK